VIDLSGMKRVEVAGKRVARAEAGSLVHDLDEATQRFRLAMTSGGCPAGGGGVLRAVGLGYAVDRPGSRRLTEHRDFYEQIMERDGYGFRAAEVAVVLGPWLPRSCNVGACSPLRGHARADLQSAAPEPALWQCRPSC
jgi:hypothetical protein